MIILENVWKTINGKKILRGVNLMVKPKEIHAYLGHNGAGKTTTFRIILGLFIPESGNVKVFDTIPFKNPQVRARIGYLPEYDLLYPSLTVYDNLRRYALLKGTYDKKDILELLEFFELNEYTNKKVSSLSSGTQRRVAIARAFLGSPEVLILDEPTRGLDPSWRLKFKHFLRRYARKNDASIIFSTHILSDVDEICDTVTVIREGQVLFSGSLEKFRKSTPTGEFILIKVTEMERAIKILQRKGYSPKIIKEYIALKDAEPSELNKLLINEGITVEEIKRNEPSLEEVYSTLYGGS